MKWTRFRTNLFFAILSQATVLLLNCLIFLFLPKVLGVVQFAYWQLFVFYSVYVGFFHFGVSDGIYLRLGGASYESLDKRVLGGQFRLLVSLEIVILVIAIALSFFFVKDTSRLFVIISVSIYMIAGNVTWYFGFIFQAVNDTKRYSIAVIISKLSFLGFVFILLLLKFDRFEPFVVTFVASQIIVAVYSCYFARDIVFAKKTATKAVFSAFVANAKVGAVLMFANVAGNLILGSGKLIVDKAWGLHAFGKFAFAISLSNLFLQFITQISTVLFPALRQSNTENIKNTYHIINRILDIILPLIFLGYIPAKMLLSRWLPQYTESFQYLALLLPICLFDGKMSLLCNTFFKVFRKEKILLWVNSLSVFLSIGFSIFSVYAVKSMVWVVVLLVAVIALRSIFSQMYLAKMMRHSVRNTAWQHVILSGIFMASSYFMNDGYSFVLFLGLYIIYLFFSKNIVKDT